VDVDVLVLPLEEVLPVDTDKVVEEEVVEPLVEEEDELPVEALDEVVCAPEEVVAPLEVVGVEAVDELAVEVEDELPLNVVDVDAVDELAAEVVDELLVVEDGTFEPPVEAVDEEVKALVEVVDELLEGDVVVLPVKKE
jgi:hypothetical protein